MGFIRGGLEGGVFVSTVAFLLGLTFVSWLPAEILFWASFLLPRMLAILLTPLVAICSSLFLALLTSCDPRLPSHSTTSGAAIAAVITLPGLLAVPLELLVIAAASQGRVGTFPFVLVACLLQLALGGLLPHLEPNYVLGICDVWTLQSERVWKETHFFASYAFGVAGVAGVVLVFFVPSGLWQALLMAALVLAPTAVAVVYSYLAREDAQFVVG